jgi:dienelactone hydrolase
VRRAALAALLLAAAAGCGGSHKATPTPFDYDDAVPLAFQDNGRVNQNYPIAIRDVSYESQGARIPALLVEPPGRKHLPGVVYLTGSGGDRSDMLVPATFLAGRGAVALLFRPPSSDETQPAGLGAVAALRWQKSVVVRDVVAARRAIDLLRSLPEVDPARIGFVGWSLGARSGAILAGVDRRPRAFVLMSGGAPPVSDYLAQAPKALRPQLEPLLRQIDPLRWVALAPHGALLLQGGRTDSVVPHAALTGFAAAAPAGTTVRWYAGGHSLNVAAFRDQLDWLTKKLPISGPAVPGARTGP